MNLATYLSYIEAGGPGSGCKGPNCGRPATNKLKETLQDFAKRTGPNSLWARLGERGHVGVIQPFSADELKTLNSYKQAGDCKTGYCYMNAQQIASAGAHDPNIKYTEGLMTMQGVPLDHAWIEYKGKVWDPTVALYKPGEAPDYNKPIDNSTARQKLSKAAYKEWIERESRAPVETPDYVGVTIPKELIYSNQLATKKYSPLTGYRGDAKFFDKVWKQVV